MKLCPSIIANGHLAANCERQIGNSCSFTCDKTYRSAIGSSYIIICTTGGIWNEDAQKLCIRKILIHAYRNKIIFCIICFIHTQIYITLFAAMKCPLNDRFISPTCQGLIGEKCDVTCGDDNLLNTAQIVCLSSGSWDKDARDICIQNNQRGTVFKLL